MFIIMDKTLIHSIFSTIELLVRFISHASSFSIFHLINFLFIKKKRKKLIYI